VSSSWAHLLKEQRSSSLKAINKHVLLVIWVWRILNKREIYDFTSQLVVKLWRLKYARQVGQMEQRRRYTWNSLVKNCLKKSSLVIQRKRWQDDAKIYFKEIANNGKLI
jgi:hypothetical protein